MTSCAANLKTERPTDFSGFRLSFISNRTDYKGKAKLITYILNFEVDERTRLVLN